MSGPGTHSTPIQGHDPAGLRSFAVQLRRMNNEFNRIAHDFPQSQGLHLTDVQALIAILDAHSGPDAEGEPMTPGRPRKQLNLTSGAVTACVDRLEKAGHIRRVRPTGDRRAVHMEYAEGDRKSTRLN